MAFTEEQRAKAIAVNKQKAEERRKARVAAGIAEALGFRLPKAEDWRALPVDEAKTLVERLQRCYQEGARIYNERAYSGRIESYVCMVCDKKKPVATEAGTPNYVWRDDRLDQKTGILTTRYICSMQCHFRGSNDAKINQPAPEIRSPR